MRHSRDVSDSEAGSAGTIVLSVETLTLQEAPMTIGKLTCTLSKTTMFLRLTVSTPQATTMLHASGSWKRPHLTLNSGHLARWCGTAPLDVDRPYMAQYQYRGRLGTHVQF